jgi:hypothetical protein
MLGAGCWAMGDGRWALELLLLLARMLRFEGRPCRGWWGTDGRFPRGSGAEGQAGRGGATGQGLRFAVPVFQRSSVPDPGRLRLRTQTKRDRQEVPDGIAIGIRGRDRYRCPWDLAPG